MKYITSREEFINEASFTRIWQMMDKSRTFGTMTAFRGNFSLQENRERNRILKERVRELNLGYWEFQGYWIENEGTPEERKVHEENLFISTPSTFNYHRESVNEDYEDVMEPVVAEPEAEVYTQQEWKEIFLELLNLFKDSPQEACLIKYAGEDVVKLLERSGNEIEIGKFHPNKAGNIYSELKNGSTFVFESIVRPQTWAEAILFKKRGQMF